jgi:hypothetical protein
MCYSTILHEITISFSSSFSSSVISPKGFQKMTLTHGSNLTACSKNMGRTIFEAVMAHQAPVFWS